MKTNLKRAGIGVFCLLAMVGRQAMSAADEEPVALHQTLKKMDSAQYRSVMKITWDGGTVQVEGNRKYTVQEIKDSQNVVMMLTDLGGKLDGTTDTPPAPPVTLTLDSSGKMLTYKPELENNPYMSTSTQHLVALVDRIIFPDKPVKAGETWSTELDNPQVKNKKVLIKTTFIGMDKADGAPAWKVKQTLEADTDTGSKMTAEATCLLDPLSGQIIEADEDIKGIPGAKKIDSKGKIQRVKPGSEKKAAP